MSMVYGVILYKIGASRVWLAQERSRPKNSCGFREFVWTKSPADAEKFSTIALADQHAKSVGVSQYYIGAVPPTAIPPNNGVGGTPVAVAA